MAEVRLPFTPQSFDVAVQGPAYQAVVVVGTLAGEISWPATIAAAGTFTSGVIPTGGMTHVALGGTLTQTGSLEIQPYVDAAGNTPSGAASKVALAANTGSVLDVNVGVVMGSLTVSILNTGGAAGTLTNPVLVMQSK
jgi:hypothetical protein